MPRIRPLRLTGAGSDLAWVEGLLDRAFGGRNQARLGRLVDTLEGPGIVALDDAGRPVGLITWVVGGADSNPDAAEIRVLVVSEPARRGGVGSELLAAAEIALREAGVGRAWLVTTNDNLDALVFYQRRGWRLAELRSGAVDVARATVKPGIPRSGGHGIPIHDELVLARDL